MSLPWLCGFIAELYDRLPDDLGVRPVAASRRVEVLRLEADELWSFVGSKANKQWVSPRLESGN